MTEPTDAEIVSLMRDGNNCNYNDEAEHIDFARAVLAKWGQPAQATKCECTLAQRCTGSGCRYCNPQEYIDMLHEQITDAGTAQAGEPIGHLYCGGSYGDELADWEIVADQHQCDKLNEHHGSLGKEAKLPIYTTTQPTQAQVGSVESAEFGQFLSDVLTAAGLVTHGKQCKALGERLADMCTKLRHHGIKGGQHGTDEAGT